MSTPIESNTSELREVLNTVNNLPNAMSGSAEPDMVIALTMPLNYGEFTSSNTSFSIESGSLVAVAEAFRDGRCPVVKINHSYVTRGFDTSWPVVERGVYDCEVLYYGGYINFYTCLPPYFGLFIQMHVDMADDPQLFVYPYNCTTIQVI